MVTNKQESRQYINKGLKGWKRYLPLINIALFFGVIALGVIGVALFYVVPSPFMGLGSPKTKTTSLQVSVPTIKTDTALQEEYNMFTDENVFSPSRKEWTLLKPKAGGKDAQKLAAGKVTPKVPPKQINLYGVAIFGGMKKALVKNTDPATYRVTPFVYVKEGDDVGGYKVKSIEPNLVRLVWEGQEFVVSIFEAKGNVKAPIAPAPIPPMMRTYTPPTRRLEGRKRPSRETGFPPGRTKRARDEDWDEDWDEEEEYWDEDYEDRGTRSRSRRDRRPPRRPRRR